MTHEASISLSSHAKAARKAFAALLLGATVFCAVPGTSHADSGKPLVIARNMDLNSLDPKRAFCDTCQIYLSATYQTLVGITDDLKLVPKLASSWEINENQTKFTFHINDKAVFSDGSPVEAKDVKWSLDRLQNIKSGPSFMMDGVTSVEATDAHTVTVTLGAPNSEFLSILTAPVTGIVNSTVAEANGAKADPAGAPTDTAEGWFLQHSAGSGPYVLASYKPNDELRLVRNEKYWGKPAPMGEVIIKQVKDAVAQAQMLDTGGADIASQIDPDTAKTMQSPDVVVSTVPAFSYILVALIPKSKFSSVPLTKEIRQAIGYAIDYQGIIDFTLGGDGHMQASPIPNGFPGSAGLTGPVHDVEKAKELLAKAGITKGIDMEVHFPNVNQYGVDFSLVMQKIQQDLAKVNINIKLQPVTFPVWLEEVKRGDISPMTVLWSSPDYYGSGQYVQYYGMMPSTTWAKRVLADKDPEVMNPKEEEALAKALASGGDKMQQHFNQAGQEMINDRIIVPLVSPNYVLSHLKDIKGLRYSVSDILPLAEISRD